MSAETVDSWATCRIIRWASVHCPVQEELLHKPEEEILSDYVGLAARNKLLGPFKVVSAMN